MRRIGDGGAARGSTSRSTSTRWSPTCRSPSGRSPPSPAASRAQARLIFMDEPTASLTRAEVDRLLAIVARLKAGRHRRRLRLAPARRDRAGRRAGHRDARRPQGRHLAGRRGRPAAHRPPDDRPRHRARRRRPRHERAPSRCSRSTGLSRRGEFADVSLTLHRGEVLGIVGLLGSGRTELALTLFGMSRAEGGRIAARRPRARRSARTATRCAPASPTSPRTGCRSASCCRSRSRTTSSSR